LAERLGGVHAAFARVIAFVPERFRDALYDAIARSRYRVFGRVAEACPLVPERLKARFDLRP
jgi:predicted DCC family thiol-disulfide oxidoreductase YuxK